jgi:hypothetical protein
MSRRMDNDRRATAAAAPLGALLRLREWRLEQSRLDLERCRRDVNTSQLAVQEASTALGAAVHWSASRTGLAPALHARTLHHLARLAADADRASADLRRRQALANESRCAVESRSQELDVLHRACEHIEARHRAALERAAWNRADDAWLAAKTAQVGA